MPSARMLLATLTARYIASLAIFADVIATLPPVNCDGNVDAPQLTVLPVVGLKKEIPLHHPTASSGGAQPPKARLVLGGQLTVSCTVLAQPSVKKTATFTASSPVASGTLSICVCPSISPACE